MSWAVEVVAPLRLALPPSVRPGDLGGRTGYLPLDKVPSEQVALLGLPAPDRPAVAEPPLWMAPELLDKESIVPPGRYIPVATKHLVFKRDQGACQKCGSTTPPLHFDHRYPYSKGGTNDPDNLQLLCRTHNLEKAASVPDGLEAPDVSGQTVRLLEEWGDGGDTTIELAIKHAIELGRTDELLQALADDPEVDLDALAEAAEVLLELGVDVAPGSGSTIALDIVDVEPALALALVGPDRGEGGPELDPAVAFVRSTDPSLADLRRSELLEIAARSDDPGLVGRASLALGLMMVEEANGPDSIVADGLPTASLELFRTASRSTDPASRAEASYILGQAALAAGDPEAADLLRASLTAPDEQIVTAAAVALAFLIGIDDPVAAIGLARRSLTSADTFIRDRSHLLLALFLDDDTRQPHLAVALASETPEIQEIAKEIDGDA